MAGYVGRGQPVAVEDNSVETEDIIDGAVTDVKLNSAKLNAIADNANNYTHPANHTISVVTGLQAALDSKTTESYVDGKITDLIGTSPDALNTLQELGDALGDDADFAGSMTTALSGKVDDSQVLTNVPAGALFTDTDTIYTHPTNHAISVVTGLQAALDGKVDDSQVLTNVPSGALFTDTNTIYSHPAAHAISEITNLQTELDDLETLALAGL